MNDAGPRLSDEQFQEWLRLQKVQLLDMWSADVCAAYLGYTTEYFLRSVACSPKFPKSTPGGRGRPRLWIADEVRAHARSRVGAA